MTSWDSKPLTSIVDLVFPYFTCAYTEEWGSYLAPYLCNRQLEGFKI